MIFSNPENTEISEKAGSKMTRAMTKTGQSLVFKNFRKGIISLNAYPP
jgi:hypothetical protein